MILEINTIEFMSLIRKAHPDKEFVSYVDLHEMANKIKRHSRGIRLDVSDRSIQHAANMLRLERERDGFKTNSIHYKRLVLNHSIPSEISSRLLKILKEK